jgi:SAM-dependent methyltransferase
MLDRLAIVQRRFDVAADVGTPLPLLAEAVAATGRADRLVRLAPLPEPASTRFDLVVGDEEILPFAPQSLDLAVSALSLQLVNDLPGVFAQIRRALRPDGLFLAAMLGGETLRELAETFALAESDVTGGASPHVAPFVEVRAAGALLQRAGFALPVVDQDRVTVRYADPLALMRDLRAMGASNALAERSRRPLRRDVLIRAASAYAERFADPDGRIRATFDVISLSGWVPHESQQKPLRPGSAKARLADALGVAERSTGEKAGRLP